MRMSEKWTPTTLDEVVGQPGPVSRLKRLANNPRSDRLILIGPPGIGKSCSAAAFANDLGCCEWSGRVTVSAARLGIEQIDELWRKLSLRPMNGCTWKVLVIEEMERCVSDQARAQLKVRMSEGELPDHVIVLATSNETKYLDPAILERFDELAYSGGDAFHEACIRRLQEIWFQEMVDRDLSPVPSVPSAFNTWGVDGQRFSMRMALNRMGIALDIAEAKLGRVPA